MRTPVVLVKGFLLAALALAQNPSVVQNGVLNAAGYVRAGNPGHAVAPGSVVAIFGSDLAPGPGSTQADSLPLPQSLGGVSVRMNDLLAPLLFVSGGQINAQVPWGVLPPGVEIGFATVIVSRGDRSSAPVQIVLARVSPGIFTIAGNGLGPAVIVNASDGSVAQPSGTVPGVISQPARPGQVVIIYANGLGLVSPPAVPGVGSLDFVRRTVTTPMVLIGGREAEVQFSGLTPQFPGVNQLNVLVPTGLTPAIAVPVQLRVGGITTTDLATMAIGSTTIRSSGDTFSVDDVRFGQAALLPELPTLVLVGVGVLALIDCARRCRKRSA